MAKNKVFRVISRGTDGMIRTKEYASENDLLDLHAQIGVDDCSTDLSLRGLPVFRGLIGPMAEGSQIVRYESPDVFEALTKEWVAEGPHKKRRRRRTPAKPPATSPAPIIAGEITDSTSNQTVPGADCC